MDYIHKVFHVCEDRVERARHSAIEDRVSRASQFGEVKDNNSVEWRDGAKFCARCGAKLIARVDPIALQGA